jgi:hypothetical protein
VVTSAELAEEGGEKLTPGTIIGRVKFQGDGEVSFDIDGGERGSRIRRSGGRKGCGEGCSKSRGGIGHDLVVGHGRRERRAERRVGGRVVRGTRAERSGGGVARKKSRGLGA